MVKTTRINWVILLVLFLAVSLVLDTSHTYAGDEDNAKMKVDVNTGYYADLDSDGIEDDVYVKTYVDIDGIMEYSLNYSILLTQPSGFNVSHSVVINDTDGFLIFETIFYGYAIESGDYQADVEIFLEYDGKSLYGFDSLVFDPPGATPGTGTIETTVR